MLVIKDEILSLLFALQEGDTLSKLYKLPCFCGLFISIETNQAGRQIDCSCGQKLQVPTLSGILNLEPVTDQEVREKGNVQPTKSSLSRSIHAKQVVLIAGVIALIVSSLLFVFGSLFSISVSMRYPFILVKSGYPQLHDVCLMQRHYRHTDGKLIGRDSQPISPRDVRLLVDERIIPPYYVVWSEETINKIWTKEPINNHSRIQYLVFIEMHDHFKGGLEFSYNFNVKYESLVFYYWARFVVFGVLTLVSLVVLIVGVFLPRQVEDVGERGGESWE